MANDRRCYLTWLRKQMRRLDEIYGCLESEPMLVEEVYLDAGKIAEEAGNRAMQLGLPEIHAKSVPLVGMADPIAVKTYLAECVKARQVQNGENDLLTVNQVADRLGISDRTLYRLCDEGTLPHLHIGSGRGTIRIRPDDLAAFQRKTVEMAKPKNRITLEQLRAV